MLPVSESESVVFWSTAKINDESHDQKTNNCDDLHTGKNEFGFTIDGNGENVETDDENDNEGDPNSDADVIRAMPVSDDDRGS